MLLQVHKEGTTMNWNREETKIAWKWQSLVGVNGTFQVQIFPSYLKLRFVSILYETKSQGVPIESKCALVFWVSHILKLAFDWWMHQF